MSDKRICYVGGGYVGMSGAAFFALAGHETTVLDVNPEVVDTINHGDSPVTALKEFLGFDFGHLVEAGVLDATEDLDDVKECNVYILAVPTEKDGQPWMDAIESVVRTIGGIMHAGDVMICESTLRPGEARRVLIPALEDVLGRGFELGKHVFFGVAPRRDWFASQEQNVRVCERVIGAADQASLHEVYDVLSLISQNIHMADLEVAEMVKAVENAMLHVPVVFGMELASAYPDVNVRDVLRLAGTHWRIAPYYPSLGVGGYCVPLATRYLVEGAGAGNMPIGEKVIQVDDDYRELAADVIRRNLPDGGDVLFLGMSYKPGFKVSAMTPTLGIVKALQAGNVKEGQTIRCFVADPLFNSSEISVTTRANGVPAENLKAYIREADAIVLVTPHEEYRDVTRFIGCMKPGTLILDSNDTWGTAAGLLLKAGMRYRAVGKPGWMDVPTPRY